VRSLHVTAASFLFILSSLIGLWYSAGILPRYIATYRATLSLRDPGDRRLAEGLHFEIMVGEIVRCALHALFLVAGIWSLTIAPAPAHPEGLNERWFGVYLLWTLVTANICLTINTLTVRRGYRTRRGERTAKILPTRDQFAGVLMRVRRLEGRGRAEERADLTDHQQGIQDERLTVTEDVLEITHTITKKTDEPPD
jgi:hypothetical protein